MWHEHIWSTHSWRNAGLQHDCTLVVEDETKPGIKGLMPVCVKLFFSFVHQGKVYPCTLVDWFKKYSAHPDKEMGMWKVRPHMVGHQQLTTVIHLDSLLRGAHLLLVFGGATHLPTNFHFSYSLDTFEAYFINKYADNQMYEICS
jgi:hypothetical protein